MKYVYTIKYCIYPFSDKIKKKRFDKFTLIQHQSWWKLKQHSSIKCIGWFNVSICKNVKPVKGKRLHFVFVSVRNLRNLLNITRQYDWLLETVSNRLIIENVLIQSIKRHFIYYTSIAVGFFFFFIHLCMLYYIYLLIWL